MFHVHERPLSCWKNFYQIMSARHEQVLADSRTTKSRDSSLKNPGGFHTPMQHPPQMTDQECLRLGRIQKLNLFN
jgi:hypothetical protein